MKRAHRPVTAPICPYCSNAAVLLTDSSEVYHGRDFGPVWLCRPCGAWVGTHKNSSAYAPLGRLSNADLRQAKTAAHAAFDPLWRIKMNRTPGCTKPAAREAAYQWLAGEMGIKRSACHIGLMNEVECALVVEICGAIGKKAKAANETRDAVIARSRIEEIEKHPERLISGEELEARLAAMENAP